jgi:hypothetical protein
MGQSSLQLHQYALVPIKPNIKIQVERFGSLIAAWTLLGAI